MPPKIALRCLAFLALAFLIATPTRADPAAPIIHVVVWDEQQPAQKAAYPNFLGNAIAEYLKTKPNFEVKSVRLDDPDQGLSDETLDHCDVLIWWGHIRNRDVKPELGYRILQRIKAGKLSLISLHSAHWSAPFIAAMNDRAISDALAALPEADRKDVKVTTVPMPGYNVPKADAPLTPSSSLKTDADGQKQLTVILPLCVFPAYRADGKPGHLTTLAKDHPITKDIPETFDVPHTEMYSDPFHVPAPDVVLFEEKWDAGEHFKSGCLWNIGKGKVFYFRPGHETYDVYKQPIPLKILENAATWMASENAKAN